MIDSKTPSLLSSVFLIVFFIHSWSFGMIYDIPTLHRTYFKLDENRHLFPYIKDGNRFYEVEEAVHHPVRQFDTTKTLLIIMDPWNEVGDERLNTNSRNIFYGKLLPLAKKMTELGFPAIVLTNAKDKDGYGYDIFPELKELAAQGKLEILYHQEHKPEAFAADLKARGIANLVYCGFNTNMCVIGRPLGIIRMVHEGFRIFFVPDAAAAIEHKETWEDQGLHKAVTMVLSQWAAELIDVDDVLKIERK